MKGVEEFEALRNRHMPTITRPTSVTVLAESVELLLPSAVGFQHQDPLLKNLRYIECLLQFSQALDALGDLRES
jgi:hypothetical protein